MKIRTKLIIEIIISVTLVLIIGGFFLFEKYYFNEALSKEKITYELSIQAVRQPLLKEQSPEILDGMKII